MGRYIEETEIYKLVEPRGVARVHCSQIDALPRADVVPRSEVDILKSLVTHKEEEAYNKGYEDGKADILAEKGEWISVKDRLPNNNQQCLIFTTIYVIPDHIHSCDHYYGIELSRYFHDLGFTSKNGIYAKYWMPLPEAPKMKGGVE